MRWALVAVVVCITAAAQQPPGLIQFLGLTTAQTASVRQLNDAFSKFSDGKNQRLSAIQAELLAEYAKASPDAYALGVRYIEVDSINHDLAVEQANVQVKVTALLGPAQIALVQQIAASVTQSSLALDASCGYLADMIPNVPTTPTFAFRSGDIIGAITFTLSAGETADPRCPAEYPISIRTYLALTDSEVSGILALETAYNSFNTQKQDRIAEVQIEINDETSKPAPASLALGVRYAELGEIQQELTTADQNARAGARNLLTMAQQVKLKELTDTSALSVYQFSAEGCEFLPVPPGTSGLDFGRFGCVLN